MIDRRKRGTESEAKRSGSSGRFYAEDISKKPVNMLSKTPQQANKCSGTKEKENKENMMVPKGDVEAIKLEKELTSIIHRVNNAMNRSPARKGPSHTSSISPEIGKTDEFGCVISKMTGSTFTFDERIEEPSTQRDLGIMRSLTNHELRMEGKPQTISKPPLASPIHGVSKDSQKKAAGPEVSIRSKVQPQPDHNSRNIGQIESNVNSTSALPHLKRECYQKHEDDILKQKIEQELLAIRRMTSAQSSVSSSNLQTHVFSFEKRKSSPEQLDLFENSSIQTLSQKIGPHQLMEVARPYRDHDLADSSHDAALLEIKMEEVCTRIKFIIKKEFSSLRVMLKLLRTSIIQNEDFKRISVLHGPQVIQAFEKLQAAVLKAGSISSNSDFDNPSEDRVIAAVVSSLKSYSKELLLTLKAYSSKSLAQSTLYSGDGSSLLNSQRRSKSKSMTRESSAEESFFENNHLKLVKSKEKPCRRNSIRRSCHQYMPEFKEDYQDKDSVFKKIDTHNFGFKIHSLTSHNRKVYIGFEDGAISEIAFDRTQGIKMIRCMRFRSEPITELMILETHDPIANQTLVVASGINNPVLILVNLTSGNQVFELEGHSQFVTSFARITDTCFASSSFDRSARIWESKNGSCLFSSLKHESPIISCCFSHSLSMLATGDLSGGIVLSSITLYQSGSFKSCEPYLKFNGSGPILEMFYDLHSKIVTFEGSKMRVYDCRGTLFKDIKNPHFVSSAYFLDSQSILITDMAGRPHQVDYEQALVDSTLPRPVSTGEENDEAELASLMISNRVTGVLPKAQFMRQPDGSKQVFSVSANSKTLILYNLN
jgi:hypothetical protein